MRAGADARRSDDDVRGQIRTARTSAREVTFLGGEPTILPELTSWTSFAAGIGFRQVQVQTNGRRLSYRSYARELSAAGVGDLDVSIHGHDAAVHDFHVGADGAFSQTTAGISNALAAGMSVGTTTVVTRSNFRHLEDVVRLSLRLGASRVHLAAAAARGSAEASFDSVVPRFALAQEPVKRALDVARSAGVPAIVSGFPACFLGDHAPASMDLIAAGSAIDREHVPACASCGWKGVCPGLPAEVRRRHGDAEAAPRSDSPPSRIAKASREAASLVAGPGPVESVRPERLAERPAQADVVHARLHELGKPLPALHEIRVPRRKTGKDLEEIFPDLVKA